MMGERYALASMLAQLILQISLHLISGSTYDPQILKSSSCCGVILADVSMEAGPIFVADIDHGFKVGEYPLVLQPSVGSELGDSLKQPQYPFLEAISNTTQSLLKNYRWRIATKHVEYIGKFTDKVKSFFRQGEMSTLLKECKAELQQGFAIFQVGIYLT
ncbi:hypothetical protein B0H13DRAFT_1896482 [Mycena leptocephala]|nr:hypothetical protein B0H13DRAFT_1896482 [Mycena leptocephala]